MSKNNTNGKGSRPRNNYSSQFRNNFDQIRWANKTRIKSLTYPCGCKVSGNNISPKCEIHGETRDDLVMVVEVERNSEFVNDR